MRKLLRNILSFWWIPLLVSIPVLFAIFMTYMTRNDAAARHEAEKTRKDRLADCVSATNDVDECHLWIYSERLYNED